MSQCNPYCTPVQPLPDGWHGECPNCGGFRWYNKNCERLFPVPGLNKGEFPLIPVQKEEQSLVLELKTPKTIRMIWSKSYIREKKKRKLSHIEQLIGLKSSPKDKLWEDRFNTLRNQFNKFGLSLSPLVKSEKIHESSPLLIHWMNSNPYELFVGAKKSRDKNAVSDSQEDPLWESSYKLQINLLRGKMTGNFKEKQEQAIHAILRSQGSLQVIALPTGYGKTRIAQVVSSILYANKQGPTLMISPIIALRDDQREAFLRELDGDENFPEGYKLNSKFITVVEEDMVQVKTDLIKGDVGMLCCSPEHIFTPGFGQSWMEAFRSMKIPFSTLIIDEAHLVGDWGSSFRSNFLLLGQLMNRLIEMNPKLRVILQSATITKNEKKELLRLFSGPEVLPDVSVYDVRKDLHFNVVLQKPEFSHSKKSRTIDFTHWTKEITSFYENSPVLWQEPISERDIGRSPLLIYSSIKAHADEFILPELKKAGTMERVRSFTGDTAASEKNNAREQFKDNYFDAMVATSAFGMGIDKPDLWTIGYLGLPFTLKGLYQGFGRAARKSNWDLRDNVMPKRNGNCIAVIPDVNLNKSRPWKPELRLSFAAERLWRLIMNEKTTILSEKGYMILPILDDLESTEWNQKQKEIEDYLSKIEGVDEDDEEFDDTDSSLTLEEYKRAERKKSDGLFKSRTLNLNHRMWSLACLQRSGAVSFLGFYPKEVAISNETSEAIMLEDLLRNEGHEGLIRIVNDLGHSSGLFTKNPQERFALIRIDKPFRSWESFIQLLKSGHEELAERHKSGNIELSTFLQRIKDKRCIRKSFAPAIGIEFGDVEDCISALNSWKLNSRHNEMPPVPCSHCMISIFDSNDDNLGIWLTNSVLADLGCEGDQFNQEHSFSSFDPYVGMSKICQLKLEEEEIEFEIPDGYSFSLNNTISRFNGDIVYNPTPEFIAGKIIIRDIQLPRAYGIIVRTDGVTLEIEYVMRNEFYDEQE